jgi:ABC-2 type transport system permease protein
MVFSLFTGLIFYGFWTFLAWGAMLFFSSPDQVPYFRPVLASGLAFMMLYWQLSPMVSASFGASLDLRKLLAYPVPRSKLFLIEVLLRVTTCSEMILALGGISIGLLRNPAYGLASAPYVLSGAILFAATNVLLSAGSRSLIERIFLRTKLKEVLFFLVVAAGLIPQILVYARVRKEALLRFAPSQFVWPWASVSRLMLHESAAVSALSAVAWLGAVWWFSAVQFGRSLNLDSTAPRASTKPEKSDSLMDRIFRLPSRFLPDPMAALTEKELRTYSRIPRFRIVFAMSCFFGIVLFLPSLRRGQSTTFFQQNALPIMAVYGLLMLGQISYWNSFGFDRSAVQGYFTWPIRMRDVLVAKNLTVVSLLIPQILVMSVIARLFHLPAGPGKILETIVVMIVSSLYWLAMGNISSVRIPRASNPDKMNQMANKMQALTIWSAPFLLFPVAFAYWCRWFFENELVFAGVMAIAAAVGGVVYWVALDSAVNTARERREFILSALTQSDGPLSIT